MTRSSEQKQRKKKKEDIKALYKAENYKECLDLIDDSLLKDLEVYTMKLFALVLLERYKEVLVLQNRLKEFGHERTLTFREWLMFADANKMQNNNLEAYLIYQRVHGDKGASRDNEVLSQCLKSMKELQPKVQADLDRSAEEKATKFLEDELAAASTSTGAAPTSSSTVSSSTVSSSTVSSSTAASTSSIAAASSSSIASAVSSLSLAPSVDDSPPKGMKFIYDSLICFEMEQLDELSCIGAIKIGGSSISKSCIKIGVNLPSDVSSRLKKHPYILKIEFSIYSSSLSSRVAVVEPVRPLKTFFEMKLNDFKSEASQSTANWWHYIKDDFHRIFRGVICGMVAIYSDQKVCGSDLERTLYVTEEGEAKIFHISEERFTFTQVQKEVSDLLSVIEAIITLIKPRPRSEDLQTWLHEFESLYNLPSELLHFLRSLRVRKICDNIDPMFLIDHPYIWSISHRVYFIQCLDDAIKERLIDENDFLDSFRPNFGATKWWDEVFKDKLLTAIYNFKGHGYYVAAPRVINFMHAVISHANDYEYDTIRGINVVYTPEQRESLITKVFPSIYTTIYDTLCDYAKSSSWEHTELLLVALERFSSCGSQY